ncbi:hypothetical protein [uncultured Sphingomonas sp.]|uniref:hypothetical protein n=1 Tax=uncultured Sphingomonas sp. TaxID=158754 RepID=UPI0035CA4017
MTGGAVLTLAAIVTALVGFDLYLWGRLFLVKRRQQATEARPADFRRDRDPGSMDGYR